MRQRIYIFITVVSIIGALTLSGYSQARRITWTTSWEYMVVEPSSIEATNQKLNELGAQGWELVGISDHDYNPPLNTHSSTRFVFKRSL